MDMVYKCDDCGLIFEQPGFWTESHGEKMSGCPGCGCTYEQVRLCKRCNEHYTDEEFCEHCVNEVLGDFQNYMKRCDEYAKKILNEFYDGREF